MLQVNDDGVNDPLSSIDPDSNYFDEISSNNLSSEYYHENRFNFILNNKLSNASQKFSVMHLNIRSVPKHLKELKSYLSTLGIQFSVIGLSETWITDATRGLYHIEGYELIEVNRKNRMGGGVSIYVDNRYRYKRLCDYDMCNNALESVFVEVQGNGQCKNIVVANK